MTEAVIRPAEWAAPTQEIPVRQVRKLRGARIPVLPSWTLLAQVGGTAAALWGTWAQFGAPVAGIVGGIAAVVVGALSEAGKI